MPRKTEGNGEDIFDLIKQDHRAVEALFKKIEATEDEGESEETRGELFGELSENLLAHAHAEQATLYTTLLERMEDREQREMWLEAFEEHGVVEKLVADIEACDTTEERWLAKVIVLKEMVAHHVEEEEKELFKAAKKALTKEEARALADEMRERKAEERA
jgi:hypothetical protein